MRETDPIGVGPAPRRAAGLSISHVADPRHGQHEPGRRELGRHEQGRRELVSFDRRELNQILSLYGRKVAEGEWRDYAIDALRDRAVFSIFRRASEFPIYRIVKRPRLALRQGAYAVMAPSGLILKRGRDLGRVLRVIDRRLELVER